ncbi:hypothetical protein RB595_010025 [Gaeumannomyces hyphopodioides]
MPPSRRRSRSAVGGDGSADGSVRKRQRRRETEIKPDSDDGEDEFHSFAQDGDERAGPSQRASAIVAAAQYEYQPGAILRVTVDNFVTYEHAEFYPGPNLNMVIGPNGTGKSSLVCAICLGLGYHSNVLGRATSYGEFVKHGKDKATIEIELQKRPGDERNPVIKLRINREDNSRQFRVNGQHCALKDIQKLMSKFRIQIDNLCQFLPQDKVAEFAGLSPIELLGKTLQAAAPEIMMQQQEQLRSMYSKQKEYQRQGEDETERLRVMATKQQGLQPDVERLRERDEIEKSIKTWERALILCSYQEARHRHTEAKNKKKEAEGKLKRFQQGAGPAMQAVNAKEEYARAVQAYIPPLKGKVADGQRMARQLTDKISNLDEQLKDVNNRRQALRNGIQRKKTDIGVHKAKIAELQRELNKNAPTFDAADWNTRIREKEHQWRESDGESRRLAVEAGEVWTAGKEKSRKKNAVYAQIQALDTREGQELSRLEQQFPDVAAGYKWLAEHKDEFRKEVFAPPALSCAIKDQAYSDLVQSLLQNDDYLCFVTQCKEDHTKLSDQFYRTMGLSVSIRTCSSPLDSFRSPMSSNDIRRLGLDGFAIDYLDGPEPVLAMLCADKGLHKFGVGRRDITEQQYDRLIQTESIGSFAAGGVSYRTTRRAEYGPQAVSTTTSQIRQGMFWTNRPVDSAEQQRLKNEYNEVMADLKTLGEQKSRLESERAAAEERKKVLNDEMKTLREAKSVQQSEFNKWKAIPKQIEDEQAKEGQKRRELADVQTKIDGFSDQLDDVAVKLAEAVLELRNHVPQMEEAHNELLQAQLRALEAESDAAALRDKNREVHQLLEEGKRVIAELAAQQQRVREEAQGLQREVADALQGQGDEERAQLEELYHGKTAEDVSNELEAQRSRLEYVHAANPEVLHEFERRAQEMKKLQDRMALREEQTGQVASEIARVRGEWEPRLDELIGRINEAFSYNFEQISCAGEVSVHKDEEDFDRWAIEIRVKFRPGEALQILDQHRQSGGERSVSTIFYLMSLQSMAQAPFRVVDEINQGMDPRNERMVHERMVDIACDEHSSQYFLITPKLLTGLRYHPRMKVLCIASGPHVPTDNRKVDFGSFVKIKRRLLAAAS